LEPVEKLGAPPSRGFTLIEILIVTIILGIALALTVANLQSDDRQTAQREARALMLTLQSVQDRAILGGRALGVSFSTEGPLIWERSDFGEWKPSPLRDAGAATVPLAIEALKLGATPAEPGARLVFLPEGVGLPFELTVSYRGHPAFIVGDALGNLTLRTEPAQ
jgi:general secretion pathway protein H